MATCQICGREIKAGNGRIAHHGYKRPGGGWQTSSCRGARYRPYEVACDRIQPEIDGIKEWMARTEESLAKMLADPPQVLMEGQEGPSFRSRWVSYQKPEGFTAASSPSYMPRTYNSLYFRMLGEWKDGLKSAGQEVDRLEKRLAAWIAPMPQEIST